MLMRIFLNVCVAREVR